MTIIFSRDKISSHLLGHGVTIEKYEGDFGPPTDAINENLESTAEEQKEQNLKTQSQEKLNLVQQSIVQSGSVVQPSTQSASSPIKARKSAPSCTSAWRHPALGMFSYQPPLEYIGEQGDQCLE